MRGRNGISALLAAALAAGCSAQAASKEPANAAAPAAQASSSAVRFVAAKAARGSALLEAPGRLVAASPQVALVSMPLPGRVLKVRVRPGDAVRAGQPVVEVVSPELLRASAQYQGAEARETAWGARRSQLAKLEAEKLAQAADVTEADTQLAAARADKRLALATLKGAGLTAAQAARMLEADGALDLAAPAEGVVTEIAAIPGEVRDTAGGALVRIERRTAVRIEARLTVVPPPEARWEVRFAGQTTRASLVSVAPTADGRDGATTAWFEVPGLTTGRPGQPVTVRRIADEAENALVVPAAAVALEGAAVHVFVRTAGGVEPRRVEVLATSASEALVRGELKEGEEVAAEALHARVTDGS